MSRRQPSENAEAMINAETTGSTEKESCVLLRLDIGHLSRAKRLQEGARVVEIELLVSRLDAEEEPAAAGEREPVDVEDRVIRHRQAVDREHAEHGEQR